MAFALAELAILPMDDGRVFFLQGFGKKMRHFLSSYCAGMHSLLTEAILSSICLPLSSSLLIFRLNLIILDGSDA